MSHKVREFEIESIVPPRDSTKLEAWIRAGSNLDAPLDIEIGCGVGWHPIRYATQNPERRLVAFEHTRSKFERFASRLNRHPNLNNLFAVNGNAIHWLARFPEPESVSRCLILYPNPEPKAVNKRWMRSPFMHRLVELLEPDGEIQIATNEEWYADEALEWAELAWSLRLLESRKLGRDDAACARTHFEKKYLLRGETCFDLRWRKVRD